MKHLTRGIVGYIIAIIRDSESQMQNGGKKWQKQWEHGRLLKNGAIRKRQLVTGVGRV